MIGLVGFLLGTGELEFDWVVTAVNEAFGRNPFRLLTRKAHEERVERWWGGKSAGGLEGYEGGGGGGLRLNQRGMGERRSSHSRRVCACWRRGQSNVLYVDKQGSTHGQQE
jgi:hypothetical protein